MIGRCCSSWKPLKRQTMPKTKLKQLVLITFRGATGKATVDFDPEKKVTMIFGENGNGKSSIVDGFSFLCEGKLGSLEDRSGADKDCITSIGGKPGQLSVYLETSNGKWEAHFKGKAIEVKPAQGCPAVRILRRSHILSLIDAQPKDRFKALQEYIDVSGLEKSEEALRTAVKDTNDELSRQVQAYTQADVALEKLWQAEGKPEKNPRAWAEAEKAKDLTRLKDECKAIDGLIEAIRETDKAKTALEKSATNVTTVEAAHKQAAADQKVEEQKVVGQNASLLTLLK